MKTPRPGSIAVTIGDAETAAAALTVAATSDNPTLLPPGSFVFGGSDTARTLVITPAANLSGTATVTVTVTDGNNATTTDTFVLTVNAQNDVPTIGGATAVTTNEDTASAPMTINVGDVETPDGLTVTATSSDPSVVANNGVGITGERRDALDRDHSGGECLWHDDDHAHGFRWHGYRHADFSRDGQLGER
jgi:VCBS repeat-containing protein